jgi:hypothetical protein
MSPLLFSILLIFGTDDAPPGPGDNMPPALISAIAARSRHRSMRIEYTFVYKYPWISEIERVQRIEALFVGDNILWIEKGDLDGIRLRDPRTGIPAYGIPGACLPMMSFFDYGVNQYWGHGPTRDTVILLPADKGLPIEDPRILGLLSSWYQDTSPTKLLEELSSQNLRREARNLNNLVQVRCREKVSRGIVSVHEWLIDPARDFAVLEATTVHHHPDGRREEIARSETQYEVQDGRWWPKHCEITLGKGKQVVTVQSVEFDRPTHPKQLTADALGVPIGIQVHASGFNPDERLQRLRYLGAGQTVSEAEWEKIEAGIDLSARKAFYEKNLQLMDQSRFPAWWDEVDFGLKDVATNPDDWEAYVRRWIARRTPGRCWLLKDPLDEMQRNAAWAILADSKKEVRPIVDRRIDSPATTQATTPRPAENDRRIAQIFDRMKRRLDALLRTTQAHDKGIDTNPIIQKSP